MTSKIIPFPSSPAAPTRRQRFLSALPAVLEAVVTALIGGCVAVFAIVILSIL